MIVLIDDTDNRQSHRCYSLTVFALDPQKAGSTDHSVACTPGTREEAYVGGMGGVLEWCNGVLDFGGAAAKKGGRAKIRSDLDDKHQKA